jgi:hypothetical protein
MTLLFFGLIAATPALCLVLSLYGPERRQSFNVLRRPADRAFGAFSRPAALAGFRAFGGDPGGMGCGGGIDLGGCGGDGGSC